MRCSARLTWDNPEGPNVSVPCLCLSVGFGHMKPELFMFTPHARVWLCLVYQAQTSGLSLSQPASSLSPSFAPAMAIILVCPCLSVKHFHLLWLIALRIYQLPNAQVCDRGIKRMETSSDWLIKLLIEKRQQAWNTDGVLREMFII